MGTKSDFFILCFVLTFLYSCSSHQTTTANETTHLAPTIEEELIHKPNEKTTHPEVKKVVVHRDGVSFAKMVDGALNFWEDQKDAEALIEQNDANFKNNLPTGSQVNNR